MSIAQHSVAGEGNDRPLPAATTENQFEVFSTDASTLPWKTHHAQHRALYSVAIPTRARLLLAELARTVDHEKPLSNIFMRRDNMAERSHIHIRTLSRALKDLETAGLIVRHEQRRYTYGDYVGCFAGLWLNLTEKAAGLLGLLPTEKTSSAKPSGPESKKASLASKQPIEQTRLAEPPEPVAENASVGPQRPSQQAELAEPKDNVSYGLYKDLSPTAFQKRQPGQLPSDLERLRTLGFHHLFIFRLMKEAKRHGKYLSDVVEVVWEHLKLAKRPINYLRKILTLPVDFRQQRLARHAAVQADRQAHLEQQEIQAVLTRNEGQTFFDPACTRKVTVSADGSTMHDVRETKPRAMAGNWQAGFVDALRRGQFLHATTELEEQFAQARRQFQQAAQPAERAQSWIVTTTGGQHLHEALRAARAAAGGRMVRCAR